MLSDVIAEKDEEIATLRTTLQAVKGAVEHERTKWSIALTIGIVLSFIAGVGTGVYFATNLYGSW